jgi:hypothetical protein
MSETNLKYWEHDETGRICASPSQPSERWSEIPEWYYNAKIAVAAALSPQPGVTRKDR